LENLVDAARSTVRGGLYVLIGNVLSTGLLGLTSIVMARILGPEDYGLYSLALIPASLISSLIALGINSAIINFVAKRSKRGEEGEVRKVVTYGGIYSLVSGLFSALLLLLASDFFASYLIRRESLSSLVAITSLALFGQNLLNFSISALYGLNDMRTASAVRVLQAITKLTAVLTLLLLGFKTYGAILGHSLSYLLAGLVSVLIIRKLLGGINGVRALLLEGPKVLKEMLSYGIPLYLSSLLLSLNFQVNNIILAAFTTNVEIGNYSVASKLISLITLISSPISITLFPTFSRFDLEKERNELSRVLKWSVKYTALLLVPSSAYLTLLSSQLISLVYGKVYKLAPLYLSLLTINYLYAGLGSLTFGPFFNGIGLTRVTFTITSLTFAIAVSLALPFTLTLRVPGLILANLMGALAGVTYGLMKVKKLGFNVDLTSSLKVYLSTSITSLITWILKLVLPFKNSLLTLVLLTPSYLTLYLLSLPLTKAITLDDLRILRAIFKGFKPLYGPLEYFLSLEERVIRIVG